LNSWNIRFWEYEFFAPHWLWLLCLIPVVLFFLFRFEKNRHGEVKYTGSSETQKSLGSSWIPRIREALLIIYGLIGVLIILALAKPYHWAFNDDFDKDFKDGIDIVITMDVSGSMLAEDFQPNRLEASKRVAKEFIDGRSGDRIGLVAYAGEAYTACPPTLDYEVLKKQIDRMNGDRIIGGTAIGLGLGTAVTRLRNDSIASKVIILLTDGVDGGTELDPLVAAELAKSQGIRVYTIGVGSTGEASRLVNSPFGSYYAKMETEIDEGLLKKIAQKTDGKYFRATNEKSLKEIYNEIEKLEKRKIEDQQFKSTPPPTPQAFLNWAILLSILVWSIKYILFKSNA
jgi:Ca-activated chloride channel family protein